VQQRYARAVACVGVVIGLCGGPLGSAEAAADSGCQGAATTGVTGQLDASAAITSATTDAETYAADLFLQNDISHGNTQAESCGWGRQRTRLKIVPTYDSKRKEGASASVTRRVSGDLQHLVFLPGGHLFASVNANLLHNNSLGLRLQQTYDMRVGGTVDARAVSLEVSAGPAFVRQDFMGAGPDAHFWAGSVTATTSVSLAFISAESEFDQVVRVTLPWSQPGERWHAGVVASLRLGITKRFGLTTTLYEDYVANVPKGFKKNYLALNVGPSLKIGHLSK